MKELKPFDINPVKTSIQFRAETTFLSVAVRRDHIALSFQLSYRYEEFPVSKTEPLGKNRWAHRVLIDGKEQIDDQLMGWIIEARSLA